MNLILRLKNKATLAALIGAFITLIYQILGIFGIVPAVSQDMIVQFVGLALNILVGLGVLIDPTTRGIKDSEQAMTYNEPKKTEENTKEGE